MIDSGEVRSRFSFRPDQPMHLGQAFCALLTWLHTRSNDGELVLRLRRPKKEGAEPLIVEDLRWLGLDWDEGCEKSGPHAPYEQAERVSLYDRYFFDLAEQGLAYPCYCELPKGGEGAVYDGNCRNLSPELAVTFRKMTEPVIRVKFSDKPITFEDGNLGTHTQRPTRACGDFVVKYKGGIYSHRFTNPVDDLLMNITDVVRGTDQFALTAGQIELLQIFGQSVPRFFHAPMLVTESGVPVSKDVSRMTVRRLRERGREPAQVVGWLAFLAGLADDPQPVMPQELISRFNWRLIPKEDIVLPHAFL